jgi:signal transduction histidine kinase
MNRLWVRISLVIGCIVIFVALFPIAVRQYRFYNDPRPRPSLDELSPEQAARLRERIAQRDYETWVEFLRTVLVGTMIGLAAGALLSRWLAAPLRRLEQGAHAISEGRLETRVPLQGSQEVQSAARAFNQMAERLGKAEMLRRNLLADVAHELRHPLHIVQGSLQAILDGVYPLEMEEIANLYEQTRLLTALVNDLHELAQAEAQQLQLNLGETDLKALVANVAEAYQPVAAAAEINLDTSLPESPLICLVDADRIRQALLNLLNNALRHTPPGGQVRVVLEIRGEQKSIRVQDNGAGIAPEHLPHVFDRFYSADPARSRQLGGSGLGLAIAQAIARAHGGEIEAASGGVGQGSEFIIRL